MLENQFRQFLWVQGSALCQGRVGGGEHFETFVTWQPGGQGMEGGGWAFHLIT